MDIKDIGRAPKMNAMLYLIKRLDIQNPPQIMELSEKEINHYLERYEAELMYNR